MSLPRLLVCAHDAGGAEILSSWLRRHGDEWDAVLLLSGPAVAVFARKLGDGIARVDALPSLHDIAFVLCGSSGAASLERDTVRAARAAGMRCAVWLDHWTNYVPRFRSDDGLVLPDEVWVVDERAAASARAALPGAIVHVQGNPYLDDFTSEVRELDAARGQDRGEVERVLYVTEPTAAVAEHATGDPRGWGYTEHEALAGYLEYIRRKAGRQVALRVRTHPSEPAEKYEALLVEHAATVELQCLPETTLAQDVSWAQTVVGCDTMAMVAALGAGRRVQCALPPGARPLSLPHPDIERLFG